MVDAIKSNRIFPVNATCEKEECLYVDHGYCEEQECQLRDSSREYYKRCAQCRTHFVQDVTLPCLDCYVGEPPTNYESYKCSKNDCTWSKNGFPVRGCYDKNCGVANPKCSNCDFYFVGKKGDTCTATCAPEKCYSCDKEIHSGTVDPDTGNIYCDSCVSEYPLPLPELKSSIRPSERLRKLLPEVIAGLCAGNKYRVHETGNVCQDCECEYRFLLCERCGQDLSLEDISFCAECARIESSELQERIREVEYEILEIQAHLANGVISPKMQEKAYQNLDHLKQWLRTNCDEIGFPRKAYTNTPLYITIQTDNDKDLCAGGRYKIETGFNGCICVGCDCDYSSYLCEECGVRVAESNQRVCNQCIN